MALTYLFDRRSEMDWIALPHWITQATVGQERRNAFKKRIGLRSTCDQVRTARYGFRVNPLGIMLEVLERVKGIEPSS
jgi:hypothetical protein